MAETKSEIIEYGFPFNDTLITAKCEDGIFKFKWCRIYTEELKLLNNIFERASTIEWDERKNKYGEIIKEHYHGYSFTYPYSKSSLHCIMKHIVNGNDFDVSEGIIALQGMKFFCMDISDMKYFCSCIRDQLKDDPISLNIFLFEFFHLELDLKLQEKVLYNYYCLFSDKQREELKKLDWVKNLGDFHYFRKEVTDENELSVYFGETKEKWGNIYTISKNSSQKFIFSGKGFDLFSKYAYMFCKTEDPFVGYDSESSHNIRECDVDYISRSKGPSEFVYIISYGSVFDYSKIRIDITRK